jgi:GntR family transcriptional repressor for pyruvate dehydrogenase complex
VAVTDDAIDSIKKMILEGELNAGDRLPKEAELAERLGLSRSSLREAVKALSLIGVLDVRQGDGTYVTQLDVRLLINALGFVVDFHRDDTVGQFLEIRRLLEPAAAAAAARNMTSEQVDELDAILDALGDHPSVETLVSSDIAFHQRIGEASGNQVLSALLNGIAGPTQRARTWRGLTQEHAVGRTMDEHRAIVAAIRAGDATAAEAWSTVHIVAVQTWLARTETLEASRGHLSPTAPR